MASRSFSYKISTWLAALLFMGNIGKHLQVNAIRCFVCDNIGVHGDDEVLNANQNFVSGACQQYADTKDLMPFAVTCPAKFNACQSSHGWTGQPKSDDSHAFRSCFTVPDNEKTLDCRQHYIISAVTSCPCYYDLCNYESTMVQTGSAWRAVLAGGKTDSIALATTTKAPTTKATTQAASGGSGGSATTPSDNGAGVTVASGGDGSDLAGDVSQENAVRAAYVTGTGASSATSAASSLQFRLVTCTPLFLFVASLAIWRTV